MARRAPLIFGKETIAAGTSLSTALNLPGQSSYTPVAMPLQIIHGRHNGPSVFVCAAIHGDEINGIEIIRQLLLQKSLKRLKGTLYCIPVVNVYGFQNRTRYLPDGRDLNRAFPGSERGSLAARMAYVFRKEIISRCDYGIDLHTGSNHRTNFPHIRANMDDPETARLAHAFNTAVMVNANLRDGSLRSYAVEKGIPVLLYEAGEALRFDKQPIQGGIRGILNVLGALGMIKRNIKKQPHPSMETQSSHWVRAEKTGMIRHPVKLGTAVKAGDLLAMLADLLGQEETGVYAQRDGVVIGRTNLPTVNEGDALFHVGEFKVSKKTATTVEKFEESIETLSQVRGEGLGEGDYVEHEVEESYN